MKLLKKTPTINFLNMSQYMYICSLLIIIIGLFSIFSIGIDKSIDFTGGTIIDIEMKEDISDMTNLRLEISNILLKKINIVEVKNEKLSKIILTSEFLKQSDEIKLNEYMKKNYGDNFKILQVESIGPKLGRELKKNAQNAIFMSLLLIGFYITLRFDRFYALGSLIALFHDIFLILCLFSILKFEISVAIIAAILTIVGYSLNDTIVIYDRIRENLNKFPKIDKFNLINKSLNQSLSRTIITSITTLFVVIVLYIWGGDVLRPFSLALIMGIIIGTYSSLFIASPIMYMLDKKFNIVIEKE